MEKKIKVYWVIIIVLIIVSLFVFAQTTQSDDTLVQYIGFAGSITSLVLGLIAIFYSIISNQQSTENFGKLKEAVTKIEDGARIINEVSVNINSKLDKISDDILKFGTKESSIQTTSNDALTTEKVVDAIDEVDLPDSELATEK